jgi:hypothetical protein
MTTPPPPPGWYPDPDGGAGTRYWDGESWGPVVDIGSSRSGTPIELPVASAAPPRRRKWVIPVAVVGVAAAVAGATAITVHRSQNSDGGCAVIEGMEYGLINTETDREPRIGIPLVEGWRVFPPELLKTPSDFSDLRGFVANPDVSDNKFVANIAVTVSKVDKDDTTTADEIFDGGIKKARRDSTITSTDSTTVCGYPAVRFDGQDSADGRSITTLAVVAPDARGMRWVITAAIQTKNAGRESYTEQREAMLNGIKITPAEAAR